LQAIIKSYLCESRNEALVSSMISFITNENNVGIGVLYSYLGSGKKAEVIPRAMSRRLIVAKGATNGM
jgi:hypothetical protein